MSYEIDPLLERLITLKMAADLLPNARGQRASYNAVWRWALKGVRGHHLPTVMVGGIRYTTEGAIRHWIEQTSAGATDESHVRTPLQREKAIAKANRELEQMGA